MTNQYSQRQRTTLSQKQHDFITNYVVKEQSAKQAALNAGYSEEFARTKTTELRNQPVVKKKMAELVQSIEKKRDKVLFMGMQERLSVLNRIIRAIVPEDTKLPVDVTHAATALKAIAEINKMAGDYAPERRLSVTVDATQERLLEARRQYEEF
jgi:phage terminase small subunit